MGRFTRGEYRLLRKTTERAKGRNRKAAFLWEVECPYCGKLFKAEPSGLGRSVISCGCLNRRDHTQRSDFKVLRKTAEKRNGGFLWEVECPYCTTVFKALPSKLGKGVRSCGCLHNLTRPDYTGRHVHYLYVVGKVGIRRSATGRTRSLYECICTYKGCGKAVEVDSQLLHLGKESCGCKKSEDTIRRGLDKYKEI